MNTLDFDSFVEDFLGEKIPRPLIIVGASKIDDLLYLILSKHFIAPPHNNNDQVLKGDSPLSTFSSRIKICYRLGIIDKELLSVLHQIRKIRNLCAHQIVFEVNKSPVKDHVKELKNAITKRISFSLTKQRYFENNLTNSIQELHCIFVTICVILEAINSKIKKTKGLKTTLKISKK